MILLEGVEVFVEAHHVANFIHAFAIRRLACPPIPERVHVEIVPVNINAPVGDDRREVGLGPVQRSGIAEVQHPPAVVLLIDILGRHAARSQQPVGMIRPQPGVRHHALRLEPQEEAQSVRVRALAHRREAIREAVGIGNVVALTRRESSEFPARINPIGVHRQLLLCDVQDGLNLIRHGDVVEAEGCAGRGDGQVNGLPVWPRGIMIEQQAAQLPLTFHPVALVAQREHGRCADAFPGEQAQIEILHADAHGEIRS